MSNMTGAGIDACLAEVKEHARQSDPRTPAGGGYAIRSAQDIPRLLAAVEAVLALTRDTDGNDLPPRSEVPVGEFQAALSLLTSRPRNRVTKEDE